MSIALEFRCVEPDRKAKVRRTALKMFTFLSGIGTIMAVLVTAVILPLLNKLGEGSGTEGPFATAIVLGAPFVAMVAAFLFETGFLRVRSGK